MLNYQTGKIEAVARESMTSNAAMDE